MTIEELRQEYLALGGNETDIQNINDESALSYLVQVQKSIADIGKEDLPPEKSPIEKLQELNSLDLSELDQTSDEFRTIQNERIKAENEIRLKLGMPEKPRQFLDSELEELLFLDNYEMGGTVNQWLLLFQDNKFVQQQLKGRLQELSTFKLRQIEREHEETKFLEQAESRYQSLKKFIPIMYLVSDGHIKPNPVFQEWLKDCEKLNKDLAAKIKSKEETSKHFEDIPIDRRSKLFVLGKQVDTLLKSQVEGMMQDEQE